MIANPPLGGLEVATFGKVIAVAETLYKPSILYVGYELDRRR